MDSSVLLHLLARASLPAKLVAVHIHHGLHADAEQWVRHCRKLCRNLRVPLKVRYVKPARGPRRSLENEARLARYAALALLMKAGDVLVIGHHQSDQSETFLLQALRGSGVRGLAGMPVISEFASGLLVRPLLTTPRAMLLSYARTQRLGWVDDPSNADQVRTRNFLRHRILPALREPWPSADTTLARSAALCGEAAELIAELAAGDAQRCAGSVPKTLSVTALLELTPARRRNLLLHWLEGLGLPLPTARHIAGIEGDVLKARRDATPVQRWPGVEVRRYRDELFAMPPLAVPAGDKEWVWRPPTTLKLPADLGVLAAMPGMGRRLRRPRRDERVTVRLSTGGEKIRLPGRRHHHALKDLLQREGVPPWVRRRLPLVYYNNDVAAVADLWICDGFGCAADEPGYDLHWQDPPLGTPRTAAASTW